MMPFMKPDFVTELSGRLKAARAYYAGQDGKALDQAIRALNTPTAG